MDDAYKTEFLEIYDEHVKREGADRLREYLTDKSDFFVAPASARYHCAHEGGLCEHSVNAYKRLLAGVRAEYGEDAKVSIPWRSIVNPSMIASVLALVLFFTGWQVPELVQDSLSLLGGITAPIAMLVVGVIVARSPMKNVVKEVRLYPYMIIRQLILPALFYWGFTALGVSPLLAAVFMLMFAMPAGSMCPTFVAQYNGNAQLAAKATIITTVGSFVFIPLLVAFMGLIG